MNTKILLAVKACGNGIGNTADTKLNAVTVIDHVGNKLTDSKILFIRLCIGNFGHGIINLYKVVNIIDMKLNVTECSGRVGVNFKNNDLCLVDHLHLVCVGERKRNIAVLVGHRCDTNVNVGLTVEESLLCRKMKMVGNEGNVAVFVRLSEKGSVEPALCGKNILVLGIYHKFICAHGKAVGNHNILYSV